MNRFIKKTRRMNSKAFTGFGTLGNMILVMVLLAVLLFILYSLFWSDIINGSVKPIVDHTKEGVGEGDIMNGFFDVQETPGSNSLQNNP